LNGAITANGEMLERRFDGFNNKYGIIKSYYKMKRQEEFPVTDGVIVIDVPGYGRGTDFTMKDRKNPIFMPTNDFDEEVRIYRIPEGYAVSYIPKDLDLDIGFYSIKRKYEKGQNEIKLTEIIRHKRMRLTQDKYFDVKDFFSKLASKTSQRIIIKKIDNF